MSVSPKSPSASKLKNVLPHLTTTRSGTITYTPTPNPAKGPSPTLHLWVQATTPNVSGEHEEKLWVQYSDGKTEDIELSACKVPKDVLFRIDQYAKQLQTKDEATQG